MRISLIAVSCLVLASTILSQKVDAATWVALQSKDQLPIALEVDVDGLAANHATRSLPARWLVWAELTQAGTLLFDCHAAGWRWWDSVSISRLGSPTRQVAIRQAWQRPKPGSVMDRARVIICGAPASEGRDWLIQQLATKP
jgi:hypothetical protein